MSNNVFANGREISCKKADGKSICAFPDVCMTPPENPATPPGVPVPYPNTGLAEDTTSGSKTVNITGQEVMLKNKSYFKKSMGDEAGCAAKKGIITSVNRGKVYFKSWSMDVKVEGQNVVRHMDMTTHNHASEPPQTPPWMHVDEMAKSVRAKCADEIDAAEVACKGKSPSKCGKACRDAQKCLLVPKRRDSDRCCKPDTTGHHLIEDHWVKFNDDFPNYLSNRGTKDHPAQSLKDETETVEDAPCVCANAERSKGKHGVMHDVQGVFEESYLPGGAREDEDWNYGSGKEAALWAHQEAFPDSGCSDECLEAQLDDFYGKGNSRPLNDPKKQGLGEEREELEYVWGDVLVDP